MKVLGIESSCDETAAAVVADGQHVISNIVASQVEIHAAFGGIVPEVASRQHLIWIIPVISRALTEAKTSWNDIDAIAVTKGPGLAGSLLVGVNAAKAVSLARHLPLIGINHIEGHLYANWLYGREPSFPLLCLIVSGGHSDLILMRGHGDYQLLGRTRDDAAGEAFDKAARILRLGYPGGPAIQAAADRGAEGRVKLPRAWLGKSYDFSFSGLKTAVLRLTEELQSRGLLIESCTSNPPSDASASETASHGTIPRTQDLVVDSPLRGATGRMVKSKAPVSSCDLALAFEEAVVDVLVEKTRRAAEDFGVEEVLLAGGVASNKMLREKIAEKVPLPVHFPPPPLCTDNAAMIAACGFFKLRQGQKDSLGLDVYPNLKLI